MRDNIKRKGIIISDILYSTVDLKDDLVICSVHHI